MNMLLHGFPDARIEKGDTIRDPKLVQEGELILYDRVIANPPFTLDEWGVEVAENDPYGRFRFGDSAEDEGGPGVRAAHGGDAQQAGQAGRRHAPRRAIPRWAPRARSERECSEEDLFEAVVGLPSNLFYGTGIPAAILVINRDKPAERKGKVLFIDARGGVRGGEQPELPAGSGRAEDRADVPCITRTSPRYARVGDARGDREERLESEHQPIRGYV